MKIIRKCLKLLSLLVIGLTLTTAACKKDKTPRDPFANLSNQLVCKINGKEWRSNQYGGGFYDLNPFVDRKYLYIGFRNGRQTINFFINSPYKDQTVTFNQNTIPFPEFSTSYNHAAFRNEYANLTSDEIYITNNIHTGMVDFIEMDTVQQKINAKFSFTAKDKQTGNIVTITDGYFEYHQIR